MGWHSKECATARRGQGRGGETRRVQNPRWDCGEDQGQEMVPRYVCVCGGYGENMQPKETDLQ